MGYKAVYPKKSSQPTGPSSPGGAQPVPARSTAPPPTPLVEVPDNLVARIAEATREGWLGEVEGLAVSLAGAREKLRQLDQIASRRTVTDLGIPTFAEVAGRTIAQHG
jgi:hypothetical protein